MEEFTGSCWDILFWTLCTFVSLTHFKWVSSKAEREKPQSHLCGLVACVGREGCKRLGWWGPPGPVALELLWAGLWLWGWVGPSGGSAAPALLSSPRAAPEQPAEHLGSHWCSLVPSSGAPAAPCEQKSPWVLPRCHPELAEVCNVSSPHMYVKLCSFLYSKGKPFQPSK